MDIDGRPTDPDGFLAYARAAGNPCPGRAIDGRLRTSAGMVQCPGQFSVSRSRRIEFLRPLIELASYVGQVLFEQCDATLKLVDVSGRTKAGFFPGSFTQALGQTLLQLPDPDCQPPVPLQGVAGLPVARPG